MLCKVSLWQWFDPVSSITVLYHIQLNVLEGVLPHILFFWCNSIGKEILVQRDWTLQEPLPVPKGDEVVIKVEKVKVQESVVFLAKLCKEVLILSLHNSENNFDLFRTFPHILNSQMNSLFLQIILFDSFCSLKCSHNIFNSSALTPFWGIWKGLLIHSWLIFDRLLFVGLILPFTRGMRWHRWYFDHY